MKFNLSEVTEVIQNRRTVYPEFFSDRKVHKEQIELMLDNAKWAPTHKLTQPWFFKVFYDEGTKTFGEFFSETYKKIAAPEMFSEMKYNKMKNRAEKSSAVIVACMRRDEKERVPEVEELASANAAIQNMLLTATAYGIGVYWGTGGVTYKPKMKDFLGLKPQDQVLGVLFLGYPAEEWPRKTPRKPREYYSEWIED